MSFVAVHMALYEMSSIEKNHELASSLSMGLINTSSVVHMRTKQFMRTDQNKNLHLRTKQIHEDEDGPEDDAMVHHQRCSAVSQRVIRRVIQRQPASQSSNASHATPASQPASHATAGHLLEVEASVHRGAFA